MTLTPSFIISAIPTDSSQATQYSYSSSANVRVNITPLTTLILFLANSNKDLSTLESAWNSQSNTFNQQTIDSLKLMVNTNFTSILTNAGVDPAAFDLFSSNFNADSNGFDAVLDLITFAIDDNTGSYTLIINGQPAFSFDENINNAADFGIIAISGSGTSTLGIMSYSPSEISDGLLGAGGMTIETIMWTVKNSGTTDMVTITKTSGTEDSLLVTMSRSSNGGDSLITWSNLTVSTENLMIQAGSVEFINLVLTEQSSTPTTLTLVGTLTR